MKSTMFKGMMFCAMMAFCTSSYAQGRGGMHQGGNGDRRGNNPAMNMGRPGGCNPGGSYRPTPAPPRGHYCPPAPRPCPPPRYYGHHYGPRPCPPPPPPHHHHHNSCNGAAVGAGIVIGTVLGAIAASAM